MMKEKLKIGMKLKKRFRFQTNKNAFIYKGIILSIFITLLFLIISGCQKKDRIIIYMGESTYDDSSLDELYVTNGDYEAALERCQERLKQVKEGESIEAADIYSIIGGIYAEYVEDEVLAMLYINRAIDIHKKRNDEIGLAGDYNQLAKAYINIGGEPKEGMEYLEKAEYIYKKYGMYETQLMAGTVVNKGLLQNKQGQYEKALEYYKEAQEIYEKKQIQDPFIRVYKGDIYAVIQEYKLAEEQYLEAKQIWTKENNLHYKAEINSVLGTLYLHMKEYERSIGVYEEALKFYTLNKNDMLGRAIAYSNMANDYYNIRDLDKAIESAVHACRIIENRDSQTDKGKNICKKNLKLYYEEWGDDKQKEEFEMWYKRVILEGKEWQ